MNRPLTILAVALGLALIGALGVGGFGFIDMANRNDRLACRVGQQSATIERLSRAVKNTSEGVAHIGELADAFADLSSPDPAVRAEARERIGEIQAAETARQQEQGQPPSPQSPTTTAPEGAAAPPDETTTTTTEQPRETTTTRHTLLPPPLPPFTLPDIRLAQTAPDPC